MKRGVTLIELLVIVAIIGILVAVILSALGAKHAEACGFFSSCASTPSARQTERETVNDTYQRLVDQSPAPKLENSLERSNISKRLTTFSNPAKLSYVYLVSFGKVMAFYTVKGKITSGSKRLTDPKQFVTCDQGEYDGQCETDAPELDGTYGGSGDYIYFWTTDGTYVQWNGEYMLADQPLQLTTQPELVRTVK